jgi:hypothetical protein
VVELDIAVSDPAVCDQFVTTPVVAADTPGDGCRSYRTCREQKRPACLIVLFVR